MPYAGMYGGDMPLLSADILPALHNLIGQADKQIRFIYFRVKFPQIDFFHGNPPISIFEWVNGQIEIRGAVIYTVQVRRQACPAPYL